MLPDPGGQAANHSNKCCYAMTECTRAGGGGLHVVAANEHDEHAAAQEAMAMAAAGMHPNIVRYHCAWMEDAAQPGEHHVYILMEACADSLVGQRVVSRAPMREPELLDLLRQARTCQPSCHTSGAPIG